MRGSRKKQVTRYSNRGSKPVEVSPLGDIGPLESATTVPTGWSKAEGACKSWHSPKKRQKEEKKENKKKKDAPPSGLSEAEGEKKDGTYQPP